MQIKFADDSTLDCIHVNGKTQYYQGATRDTLEFVFAKSAGFDALDAAFADEAKTASVTIIDSTDPENPASWVYDGYTLRMAMRMEPVVITPATAEAPAVTEERITVVMAQLTYIERQLKTLGINI